MRVAYRVAGWEAVAEETGARLSYDFAGVQKPSPDGKLVKRFDLLEEVAGADCVITIPKLKTHGLMRFTGATKILFGVVPGMIKLGYHSKLQNPGDFAEMLLDLLTLVRPRLAVMDAVVGMEGKGPAGGRPRQIGAIMASADSVALDAAAVSLVGMDPLVDTHAEGRRRPRSLERPPGRDPDRGRADRGPARRGLSSRHPATRTRAQCSGLVPRGVRTWINGQLLLTPKASPARCTGCKTCFESCPVKAISMVERQGGHGPVQVHPLLLLSRAVPGECHRPGKRAPGQAGDPLAEGCARTRRRVRIRAGREPSRASPAAETAADEQVGLRRLRVAHLPSKAGLVFLRI